MGTTGSLPTSVRRYIRPLNGYRDLTPGCEKEDELFEMPLGHLEKSALTCRDWPARSVTARDFTPGRQEEAEFFEVPFMCLSV
jgi:hypothetical protein